MTEGRETPEATIATWAAAWRRLDAPALTSLFASDATYVAALSGTVLDLPRSFAIAARVWSRCDIEDLHVSTSPADAEETDVRATYRFAGVTRSGKDVSYDATTTFRLRRKGPSGPAEREAQDAITGWVITEFREALSKD